MTEDFMNNTLMNFNVFNLEWDRIFLNIYIEADSDQDADFELELFDFVYNKGHKSLERVIVEKNIKLESEKIDHRIYKITLNMSCVEDRSFLDNGRWRIVCNVAGERILCKTTTALAYRFEELSRIFKYSDGTYAYNVSFDLFNIDDSSLLFIIDSYFLKKNNKWKKRNYVEEAKTTVGKIKSGYKTVVVALINLFYAVFERMHRKTGKNILIMSETKEYLWGNLLYIDQRLKERGLDKQFNISYSFRRTIGNKNSIFSWVKLVWLLCKQDYIFVDDYVPILGFLNLSKRTKLIQVWHAGVGFKSVGYSRFGKAGSPHPMASCHKKYDYALVGSKDLIHIYAEVFGIEEEAFLPVGLPRLDGFLDGEKISQFKEAFYTEYPQFKDKKLILFAPTFRGDGQQTAYYNYEWLDFEKLSKLCGDEYVFLMKMHPFVRKKADIPEQYKGRIVEFSDFKNINDLYYVTDILITDYSSNYYEYALMNKPIIFYTPDRELYEVSRGVHRSIKESAPGKVCDTFEELIKSIEEKDFDFDKTSKFVDDKFSDYNGNASDKVIDALLL